VLGSRGPGDWFAFAGNLGTRPTLGPRLAPTIELHLLGFDGKLEGKTLEAEFHRRLRGERKFPSLQALKERIRRDADAARAVMEGRLGD
jgi:riboflavin kinase/FMN adenylyltransferase